MGKGRELIALVLIALLVGVAIVGEKRGWWHLWPAEQTQAAPAHATGMTLPLSSGPVAGDGDCLRKQADLVAAHRNKRLETMRAEVSRRLARHELSATDAATVERYLTAHPDGDTAIAANGLVRWTVRITRGDTDLSYREVCVCREFVVMKLLPPPAPPPRVEIPPRCVEISFNAPIGSKISWGIGANDGPLLPSSCNAQKQGNGPWKAWWGACDECVDALDEIQRVLGEAAEIYHRYLYGVRSTRQTLRFSTDVWSKSLYICREYADGGQTKGVYIHPRGPGAWNHRYRIAIDDRMWQDDD